MVCPTLISVSLVPGPYCFWASAGSASKVSAAATRMVWRTDMFVSSAFFVVARSVGERWRVGKQMRCSSQRNAGDQVAAGLAGFLALCGFAWTGFRSVAGLILSGRPALAE